MRRLKQLVLQYDAPMSMSKPDVAEQLNLTDSQLEQIADIIQTAMPRPTEGQRPEWAAVQRAKATALTQVKQLLTTEQKQTWTTLTGAAFTNWVAPQLPQGPPRE